jgi:hypothetical protein
VTRNNNPLQTTSDTTATTTREIALANAVATRNNKYAAKYTTDLYLAALEALANGQSLRETCRMLGITPATLYSWADLDQTHMDEWQRARRYSAHTLVYDAIDACRRFQDLDYIRQIVNQYGGDYRLVSQYINSVIKSVGQLRRQRPRFTQDLRRPGADRRYQSQPRCQPGDRR